MRGGYPSALGSIRPDALHFTGNEEADRLIAEDPLALLIGFVLDQQVTVPTAFAGPLKLKHRLGRLDAVEIAGLDPDRLLAVLREAGIDRFPGNIGKRVQDMSLLWPRSTTAMPAVCGATPPIPKT